MFKRVIGLLLLTSQQSLAKSQPATVELSTWQPPEVGSSYGSMLHHLNKRVEFTGSATHLVNQTDEVTLYDSSTTPSRDGNRFVTAYYAINDNNDISRYNIAIFNRDWELIHTYSDPFQRNNFFPASDFNRINLKTVVSNGDGVLVLSRMETSLGRSGKIYVFGYSASNSPSSYNDELTIEDSSSVSIDSFDASLAESQVQFIVVTGETNFNINQKFIKLNAYRANQENILSTDFNLGSGKQVATDAINPAVTHANDDSIVIVFERPSNQSIVFTRFQSSPSFSRLVAETPLFSDRQKPTCLTLPDGAIVVASIGTQAQDNRVYLSKIDVNGVVLQDVALTADHAAPVRVGEMRLQDNRILIPITREFADHHTQSLKLSRQDDFSTLADQSEFEVAIDSQVSLASLELLPVSQNQTDALYIKENDLLRRRLETVLPTPEASSYLTTAQPDPTSPIITPSAPESASSAAKTTTLTSLSTSRNTSITPPRTNPPTTPATGGDPIMKPPTPGNTIGIGPLVAIIFGGCYGVSLCLGILALLLRQRSTAASDSVATMLQAPSGQTETPTNPSRESVYANTGLVIKPNEYGNGPKERSEYDRVDSPLDSGITYEPLPTSPMV